MTPWQDIQDLSLDIAAQPAILLGNPNVEKMMKYLLQVVIITYSHALIQVYLSLL